MGKANIGLRAAVLASVAAMTLAACGGGGDGDGDTNGTGSTGGEPAKGGTLTFLTVAEQFDHLDPQRNYTGEDLAFASGYLTRTLTAYKLSTDETEANSLTPDLATDTGTPSDDAKTWTFTLKEGPKFEDGTPITCEDVKYGVSRTFATDVITDGPQYAVAYLDIPKDKDGASVYKGPYVTKGNDTAAFDEAVECNGQDIVFHLANPVADFNYTVTLTAFAPVPKAADTGEKYDDKPVSSGPYKIQEYSKNNQLVLVRNDNWDPETDEYRPAYPDSIVVKFGVEPSVRDQRIIRDSGEDKFAASRDAVDPSALATAFDDDRAWRTVVLTSSTPTRTTTASTSTRCRTSSTARPWPRRWTGPRSSRSRAATTRARPVTVSSSRTCRRTTPRRGCGPTCSVRRSRTAVTPSTRRS